MDGPASSSPSTAGRVLVVCKADARLEVVDLAHGDVVSSVESSGRTAHEVVASESGHLAYLPVYGDAPVGAPGSDGRAIDVIDLHRFERVRTAHLSFASRPHLPLLGRDGRLYVSTELDETISVFDPATLDRIAALPTGSPQSHMFALSSDCRRVYSANVRPGTVSIIDVPAQALTAVVPVATEINRITLSPDERHAYCADRTRPRLAVVDTSRASVSGWVELPGTAFGTAITPNGQHLVIALREAAQIAVLCLTTGWVEAVIDVPPHPQAIVVQPDGRRAYSACDASDCLVEVDLVTRSVARVIPTGRKPDGIAWAPDPS